MTVDVSGSEYPFPARRCDRCGYRHHSDSCAADPQELSGRQLAAVLAALRLAQRHHAEFAAMDHFEAEGFDPMGVEEIDDLCEQLNEVIPTGRQQS